MSGELFGNLPLDRGLVCDESPAAAGEWPRTRQDRLLLAGLGAVYAVLLAFLLVRTTDLVSASTFDAAGKARQSAALARGLGACVAPRQARARAVHGAASAAAEPALPGVPALVLALP